MRPHMAHKRDVAVHNLVAAVKGALKMNEIKLNFNFFSELVSLMSANTIIHITSILRYLRGENRLLNTKKQISI